MNKIRKLVYVLEGPFLIPAKVMTSNLKVTVQENKGSD